MSVELIRGTYDNAVVTGVPRDLIVFYGGYEKDGAGSRMDPDDTDMGDSALLRRLRGLKEKWFPLQIMAWNGTLNDPKAAARGLDFIEYGANPHTIENLHPFGRLIIYGLSAGGLDAWNLCNLIQSEARYYRFPHGSVEGYVTSMEPEDVLTDPRDRSAEILVGRLRVDLLVTVDAGSGKARPPQVGGRVIPPCVKLNINHYRIPTEHDKRETYNTDPDYKWRQTWGGENSAENPAMTKIENTNRLGTEHVDMGPQTNEDVFQRIQALLEERPEHQSPLPRLGPLQRLKKASLIYGTGPASGLLARTEPMRTGRGGGVGRTPGSARNA